MGTISAEDQTIDDAISRPVILRERGLIVWTTEFTGLHVARFAPGVLPDAGCASREDYYFAQYNPDSLCLKAPAPSSSRDCTGSRTLTFRIPRKLARRLRTARVLVNRKRKLVLRGKAVRRRVTLRGVEAAHRVRITVLGRTASGKRVVHRLTVKNC